MTEFSLVAPAKVNLMLKVLGRRADGYHDLQSLMVPLTVGDRLKFNPVGAGLRARPQSTPSTGRHGERPLRIECNIPDVPTDADSLLARAFRFAAGRLDYDGGLEIRLEKKVPIGAGLGGGSSDAATVMRAVEQLTGRRLPADAHPEIAFQLGADIPFFLAGGAQWMAGVGELLTPCALPGDIFILLVNPGLHISTKAVYTSLPPELTTPRPAAKVPASLETFAELLSYVTNDLDSVVQTQHPIIATLKTRLIELGADAALMSGSGSTVFGLYSQKKNCDVARDVLRDEFPEFWVQGAEVLNSGVVQW